MKYSINSNGFIVAERDIYSLGGFIPRGSVGAKVANGDQISQDGECWVSAGDISGRPDVRVKDNAYIGEFLGGVTDIHTDGITEFSGDTLIPGKIIVRTPIAGPLYNFFCKDSFIGVSMDVLCGPSTTTTAFPFEQGDFKKEAAKGTLFASMGLEDVSACRSTAISRLGRNTYLYIPAGYRARVFWAYYDTSNLLAYSGESTAVAAGLTKLDHSVYKLAVVVVVKGDGTAMTPAQLGTSGAKILGHIGGSLLQDFRPESASGQYVMDNSSFISNTDNFGLAAIQLRYLAGSMYDTNLYTPGGSTDCKPYGTFHNVERLEYTRYLSGTHRTNVNRDRYIVAYDCPLLRVDGTTYIGALAAKGGVVLRRCIVPKAIFTDNIHNGNAYEDIDFSYANTHLGAKAGNNFDMWSSHKQGEYAAIGAGTAIAGLISRPENLAAGSILGPGVDSIPLDGSIVEQGFYGGGNAPYESVKSNSSVWVRTGKPLPTFGLAFPSLPAGYSVKAFTYMDEDFITRSLVTDPTGLGTTYPYVVMVFRKDDDSAINVTDFIALGLSLRSSDYGKVPEITGSAYVGAGCTVRGDVQLHGDPYVNRVFDVNMWERGTGDSVTGETWDGLKRPESVGYPRLRTRDVFPVDTTVDNNFTCASGYNMLIYYFGEDGKCSGWSPWGTSLKVSDPAVAYISILVSKTNGTDFIEDSDIPLANVKYVRAFKKRRYIVNELDRTSPEDIFLTEDLWRVASFSTAPSSVGKPYEDLISTSDKWCILKRLFNMGSSRTIQLGNSDTYKASYASWDALTKLLERGITDGVALTGLEIGKKDGSIVTLEDVPAARLVLESTPSPRIVTPYGVSNAWIEGTKVRMYDNSVISRTIAKGMGVILKGDAVMGRVFTGDVCMCSNGHGDAIINK